MHLDHAQCYRAICAKDTRFDGVFFTGVKTTGIYCRPVCSAKVPKSENVVFYPSAAAAHQGGFRPCLRCRPETAPNSPAWVGTSAVVTRGLRLIEEGALDGGDVTSLANRLGVGERHLRRLFLQHVGATPIAVAQARRILLAKQLIHETQLPMSDVALAAGFGSIRRFNEVFQSLFGRPPIELRRQASALPSTVNGADVTVKLRFRPPYDWAGARTFLSERLYQGVEAFIGDVYCRSFYINGHEGLVFVGPGGSDYLLVRVRCAHLAVLPKVIAHVRRCFDLDADPATIGAHLSEDPLLRPLVARRPGLRVLQSWSLLEGVVRTILGQQVTVRAAISLGQRFLANYAIPIGPDLTNEGMVTHRFPEYSDLAGIDLAFMPMPKSRGSCLSDALARLSAMVASNALSTENILHSLETVPGIGPWTLDYLALRVLRDPDALPVTDVAIKRAFKLQNQAIGVSLPLDAYGKRWPPWRA
ncbi:MAG: DNA-3-methyladenine glycosylase 2 family protein [Hyphomonadaceae bacterium]|nr:DNA-3-methyladenine glycosylase 2 family protein [Hyphomonadaceae bacterium]